MARGLGREERVEDPLDRRVVHAVSAVAPCAHQALARPSGSAAGRPDCPGAIRSLLNSSSPPCGMASRVHRQVQEHLLELPGVAVDDQRLGREPQVEVGSPPARCARAAEPTPFTTSLRSIRCTRTSAFRPNASSREVRSAPRSTARSSCRRWGRGGRLRWHPLAEQVHVDAYGMEQVPELVGHAARQHADRFELLGLAERLLQLPPLVVRPPVPR